MSQFKTLNVPLTEEEMRNLRELATHHGRSMGKQFRMYGIKRLVEDTKTLLPKATVEGGRK